MSDDDKLAHFLHHQIDCWNKGDKEGFLASYREIAPKGLSIEYVGMAAGDPWQMLEGMWQAQASVKIEVLECIQIGNKSASHHRNVLADGSISSETIELYTLSEGRLESRIFIQRP
ncbi:MAG: hypothetical protein R3221_05180 [Spongiibacter sp.]|nr:hypothetical protein [Spongiibacter sp.]